MNLLKPIVNEINDLLIKSNLDEAIDLRISNIDHYDYQINNLDSLIPQKSNESKKNIVWNEELKSAIRTLESPYYSFDWNSRLRNQIKQS